MFRKLLSHILPENIEAKKVLIHRNILREMAKMGGGVFGEIPDGHRREFFCLDLHTWVWHEEWRDEQGVYCVRTTRYDIRPQGIFKAQDGQPYKPVSAEEAHRFVTATREFRRQMHNKYDPLLAAAGV